ncbi:MAG: hypothetical protein J6S63_01750 [Atopobiaceae bacterium]|nr:hypothetical protein [Atopobiaceae bacterium]
MSSVLIDNEYLTADVAEGIEPIPHKELEERMGFSYDLMWGGHDESKHLLLCVMWKDSNKVLTKLVSAKSYVKQVNKTFAKRHRDKVRDYRCDGFFSRTVTGADKEAHGFRFYYVIDGVPQSGEVLAFMRGARCYTLCYYTRTETQDQNRPTYEAFVDSLEVAR